MKEESSESSEESDEDEEEATPVVQKKVGTCVTVACFAQQRRYTLTKAHEAFHGCGSSNTLFAFDLQGGKAPAKADSSSEVG